MPGMLVMPGALSLRLLYLWHFNVWLSQLSINNKGDILFTVDLAALRASSSSSDRLPMSVTARRCRSMWCNTASVRLRIKLAYTSSQLRLYKLYKKSIWFVKTIATYAQRFYSKICEVKKTTDVTQPAKIHFHWILILCFKSLTFRLDSCSGDITAVLLR